MAPIPKSGVRVSFNTSASSNRLVLAFRLKSERIDIISFAVHLVAEASGFLVGAVQAIRYFLLPVECAPDIKSRFIQIVATGAEDDFPAAIEAGFLGGDVQDPARGNISIEDGVTAFKNSIFSTPLISGMVPLL